MAFIPYDPTVIENVLLVGVNAPYHRGLNLDLYIQEFLSLAKTAGFSQEHFILVKLREIVSGTFLTKGKVDEIAKYCADHKIDTVVISEQLSPQQARNLTDIFNTQVLDRTQLILTIFERAAHSAEGKAQVAIAQLKYNKARLAGKGEYLSQQAGVFGLRGGPGETLKERESRHIEKKIEQLQRQLEKLHQVRETQRKRRLTAQVPHIAIIGYTNAGKSTLLNTLTHADAYAEDKLFATLDTTTRELFVDGQKKGIITDTVGFIQQLPPQLIEAFKSTLSESQYADLLLLVVDAADPDWEHQIAVVLDILQELDISKPIIYVFNKIDKLSPEQLEQLQTLAQDYQPNAFINATSKEGIKSLTELLLKWNKSIKS